jgi:hypothetical protein
LRREAVNDLKIIIKHFIIFSGEKLPKKQERLQEEKKSMS